MKKTLLSLCLFLIISFSYSQNWTKISGIMDSCRVNDLANINNKVVISGTKFGGSFPPIGFFTVSEDGGNTWATTSTIEFGVALLDALPINNIFTTYASIGGIQSQQLTGNNWTNFSEKLKFAEFSNGQMVAGSPSLDSVYYVSNSGVLGSAINSSKLQLGVDGKYFVGANNRLFLFKNNNAGFDHEGEFHYIDFSDLSSFKIPLTLDGNPMTNDNWKLDVAVTGMIMMDNGDLIASSGANGKCIKSIDNGVNWTTVTNELGPTKDIYKNSLGHIYGLVTFGRIVVSTDGGVTFNNINGNLAPQIGGQSLFQNLFMNSLDEVFAVLNNQASNSTVPANSGIYKLDGVGASVEGLISKTQFELFPNPATNFFTFKNTSSLKADVFIMNIVGTKVLNFSTTDVLTTIDISNQASGVYFLQATINGQTQTQKFIIQ
jgi:hypothetical protein